ncbi:MAG: shikimate kinase [Lachnospiraceae bacterium]|nr:shikimate kinase [Lachnospiraceae bacterium]
MNKDNIILIGMPGAGKSTVGVVLAKKLGYAFMDSDLVIQNRAGRLLHEIIEEQGIEDFWAVEEETNASIDVHKTVIATGGSAVYGSRAMEHFRQIGTVVYLKLSCEAIADRLGDLNERGVTLREGQTLPELYSERVPLYEKYADITIDCEELSIREVVELIHSCINSANLQKITVKKKRQ